VLRITIYSIQKNNISTRSFLSTTNNKPRIKMQQTTTTQLTSAIRKPTTSFQGPNALHVSKADTKIVRMEHSGECGYEALATFLGFDKSILFKQLATL
jgi:hypothetical protein